MDIFESNREAWNEEVKRKNYWTLITSEERILKAKQGMPEIRITPYRNVPLQWLSGLRDKKVLNACGGGGQQTPILAAFGCRLTTIDLSDAQIEQDRKALDKYSLEAELVNGNVLDMPFDDASFDAVIIPPALNFVDDLAKAYCQVHRVLRRGGIFMTGIANPIIYAFDDRVQEKRLKMKYTIPFSDTVSMSAKELEKRLRKKDTVEFSHTLDSILGGLIDSGFIINGFYSDGCGSEPTDSFVHDSFIAFRAVSV